ncbi:MAG: sodium-dependent transporter [Desulfoarculaceae bacterium]|nr:sodium-dependent transporter [Desulfoarculaceae bacterium]
MKNIINSHFTRIGFIMAASGSAVGLGNIWKFPYMAGEYGGGAFVLVYLLTIVCVGFSLLVAEILIGYSGEKDAVSCFEELAPKKNVGWKYAGFMGATGLLIMTFYSVVIGWILYFVIQSVSVLPTTMEAAQAGFADLVGNQALTQIGFHLLSTLFIMAILLKGIKGGIERTNEILMPTLILIILGLLFYAMTLDGFQQSLRFFFVFEFSKINSEAITQAVGHSFFTLSIGMAAILTYAASLPRHTNIVKAAFWVVLFDTSIALMAGLMMYAFIFEFNQDPAAGPGLVFISLPVVFSQIGVLGTIFAVLFFLALAFAGLTSAISIVEPTIEYTMNRFEWSRLKSTLIASAVFFIVGVFALLSYTAEYGKIFTFGGMPLFDILDKLTTNVLLPLGGLTVAIFIGFVVRKERVYAAMSDYVSKGFFEVWYFNIRFIAVPALVFTMLNLVGLIKI